MPREDRLALVLSGGLAKGAYTAGFLRGLFERPEARVAPIRVVSGTSTGALVAAVVSRFLGGGARDLRVLDWLVDAYSCDSRAVFRRAMPAVPADAGAVLRRIGASAEAVEQVARLLETGALHDPSPLRRRIEAYLGDRVCDELADADVECIVTCVSAQSADLVRVSTKDRPKDAARFRTAVYASCMMPLYMPLVDTRDGEEWMDGGVRDVAPVYAAWRAGATAALVITLSPEKNDPIQRRVGGATHLVQLFERVVGDLVMQEVSDDDVLQARYLATIGRLVTLARARGVDEATLGAALDRLNREEHTHFGEAGAPVFRDVHVQRPHGGAPLVTGFEWSKPDMERSIEAGREDARGRDGDAVVEFLARHHSHTGIGKAQLRASSTDR
jgi:NTE family protein